MCVRGADGSWGGVASWFLENPDAEQERDRAEDEVLLQMGAQMRWMGSDDDREDSSSDGRRDRNRWRQEQATWKDTFGRGETEARAGI